MTEQRSLVRRLDDTLVDARLHALDQQAVTSLVGRHPELGEGAPAEVERVAEGRLVEVDDVAVVIEPGKAEPGQVNAVLEWLVETG